MALKKDSGGLSDDHLAYKENNKTESYGKCLQEAVEAPYIPL